MESIQLYKTADGRTFTDKNVAMGYEVMKELIAEICKDAGGIDETKEVLKVTAMLVTQFDKYVSKISQAVSTFSATEDPTVALDRVMTEFRPVTVVSAIAPQSVVEQYRPIPQLQLTPTDALPLIQQEPQPQTKSIMTIIDEPQQQRSSQQYRPRSIYDKIPAIDPKSGMVVGTKTIAQILNDPGGASEGTFFEDGQQYSIPVIPVQTNVLETEEFKHIQSQLINSSKSQAEAEAAMQAQAQADFNAKVEAQVAARLAAMEKASSEA